jgi:hypothetical protein
MDRRLMMIARDYLAGEVPLDRLQAVTMDLTWDAPEGVEAETVKLAQLLDLRIAEYTGGHISEAVLKALVLDALGPNPTYVLSAGEHAARAMAGQWRSSARTQRQKLAFG